MHGGSRTAIDPRVHPMLERSKSGFQRPGRHCLHHALTADKCSALHEGRTVLVLWRAAAGSTVGENPAALRVGPAQDSEVQPFLDGEEQTTDTMLTHF